MSLPKLAGAVSKAGGIGCISTADIGFKRENFYKNPLQANIEAIGEEMFGVDSENLEEKI